MNNLDRFLGWVLRGLLLAAALLIAITIGGVAFIFGDVLASATTGIIAALAVGALTGLAVYRLGARFLDWLER